MKTKEHVTLLCILAAVTAAGAGELSPVACEPGSALSSRPMYVSGNSFTTGKKGAGLVSKHARVGKLFGKGWKLQLAIDASSTNSTAPDVIRLDFSGKGQFKDAPTAPLKTLRTAQNLYESEFGPIEIKAVIGMNTVPISVKGQYVKAGPSRYMTLAFGTALQGTCDFNGKKLPIRIIDGDNNLLAGNAWQKRTFGKSVVIVPGDTVAVDVGDGSFTKDVRRACYGSPVEVGGKWYNITISEDGRTVSAKPTAVTAGKLRINHSKWSCLLVGDTYVIPLDGGTEAVSIPAGDYVIRSYEEFSAPDDKGKVAQLSVGLSPSAMSSKVKIEAGKTNDLAIGSPLRGTVQVVKRGDQYSLGLALTDAAGRPIGSLSTYGGRRPPEPHITVKDAAGTKVHETSLEYG